MSIQASINVYSMSEGKGEPSDLHRLVTKELKEVIAIPSQGSLLEEKQEAQGPSIASLL